MPVTQSEPSGQHWVEVSGHRLRVLIRPATAKPSHVVVLLNGIGSRADVLDPLVEHLDPRLEVVRLDPPGIGRSPVTAIPYLIPQMAWTVTNLLTQLGYDKVDLAGYSWGGTLAQQIALQSSARVRRLILVSTNTGMMSVPGSTLSMAMMFNPFVARLAHADDKTIGRIYGGMARTRPDLVRKVLGPDLDSHGVGLMLQLGAAMTWTTLPATWLITQPTLVLTGDDDPMVPSINARILHNTIRRSWLRTFHGGHLDPVLDPARFAPIVSDFFTSAEPGVSDA